MAKPKAYVACPMTVTGRTVAENLRQLKQKYDVFFPPTDSVADDIGYRVAQQSREEMAKADIVFVCWDGKSRWVLFAMGMAFALGKPISIIDSKPPTEWVSFENVLYHWHKESQDDPQDATTDGGAAKHDDTG